MSTTLHYAMSGLGLVGLLAGLAVLVAVVYLYARTRLRGTLWLLIWKSPIMALGSYLYLRSDWRWPKSLLIWVPFGLLGLAAASASPWAFGYWIDYVHSHGIKILGMTPGTFVAFKSYAMGLITTVLLLVAVIFLTLDLLRLTRPEVQEATPELES